jgi:hypothetical protein
VDQAAAYRGPGLDEVASVTMDERDLMGIYADTGFTYDARRQN